jgi:hypothetical protein
VLAPNKNPTALTNKNAELSVRLKVAEEQVRLLREENQRLKALEQAHEQLKSELSQKIERTALLEEELRWLISVRTTRATAHTGTPGSVPRERTSAAHQMQQHTATQIQPNLKSRTARAQRTQIDKARARLRHPHRLRWPRLSFRATQNGAPAIQARRADSLAIAEGPSLQSALRKAPYELTPTIRPSPSALDLLHRSLQWLSRSPHFPRRYTREQNASGIRAPGIRHRPVTKETARWDHAA